MLRSLSTVHEASRPRLPFPDHGNPPYFQHIIHFYNQSHTCCAHTPSLTETPRRWPRTKHCHGWLPFPPIRWRGHFGGDYESSGVQDLLRTRGESLPGVVRVGMCPPALQLPCWHKSAHQCEPMLSLFLQVYDLGGAAWQRLFVGRCQSVMRARFEVFSFASVSPISVIVSFTASNCQDIKLAL